MRYNNTYRTESTRLQGWDYGEPGLYYVTICTKNMQNWFGEIVNDKTALNAIGKIVKKEWLRTANIRENIELDEWIIMPNHLHGIIWIKHEIDVETTRGVVSNQLANKAFQRNVSTTIKPNSLGSIIGQFKSICTKRIRLLDPTFAWQSRFYDHIIRDEHGLENIRRYIANNPLNWKIDHIDNDTKFIKQLSMSTKMQSLQIN